MSRYHYGVGIGRDRVCIVVRTKGGTIWSQEVTGADLPVSEALAAALVEMPRQRVFRPRACIALGPSLADFKPLSGLPATDDVSVVNGILRESPRMFFTGNDREQTCGGAWRSAANEWWGAALDSAMIAEVDRACRQAGVHITGYVPAAALLPLAVIDTCFDWQDGDVRARIQCEDHKVTDVVRTGVTGLATAPAAFVQELADHLNPHGIADAWSAASVSSREPIPRITATPESVESRRSLHSGAAALAAAVLIAAALPLITMRRPAVRLESQIAALRDRTEEASAIMDQLQDVDALLRDAAAYDQSRTSMTTLLDDVAHAVGESGHLESFSLAGDEPATLTLISADLPSVLDALRTIPGLVSLTTAGPVERHVSDSGPVQRVSVRLNMNAAVRRELAAKDGNAGDF